MSLFAALTVAVGGLDAQSRAIGNISDNIANSQTVGFKRIDTSFESLVTQSNLTLNDPGGVRASPLYQNNIQGNLVQSQSPTSLAISGNGFFTVRAPEISSSGTASFGSEDFYTRRGDFKVDKDGFLVNGANYLLTGFSVDSTGAVDTSAVVPIEISVGTDNPVKTTEVSYAGNLPASAAGNDIFTASTVQIFDALGSEHSLSLQWTRDPASSPTNSWFLDVTPGDAETAGSVISYSGSTTLAAGVSIGTQRLRVTFGDGVTGPAGTIDTISDGSGTFFTPPGTNAAGDPATVSFTLDFPNAGQQIITLDLGTFEETAGVTQYDASDISVTSFEQNGIPQGSFRDLSVDDAGFVSLNYDNGRSRTLYQIPLVQFNSPNSLQRIDGGAFSRTLESGTPRRSTPGSNGTGRLIANTLEGSNVDIADEFTKMIQAQRVYSANARTITTTNSMLEEVINIVR